MKLTADQISRYLGGAIDGNPEVEVDNVSRIQEGKPGTLSFLSNLKYQEYLYSTKASIVLVARDFVPEKKPNCTLVKVDDPYRSLAKLLNLVEMKDNRSGISAHSFIHDSAKVDEDAYVGSFAYIGKNTRIGKNVKIFPNVYISDNVTIDDDTRVYAGAKIHHNCKIGKHCIIHSGVVIGGDGFGFAPHDGSDFTKVPQIGDVIIEDYVEIGSNTTIDRATIGSTIIKRGVKLDNLIQIAHNVVIGENTVIAAQTGVSGSTTIGNNCMIGGQVGIIGHLKIADGTKIAAQSGIGGSVKQKGMALQGSPAFEVMPYQRSYVMFRKLPELENRLAELEESLARLKEKL